LQSCRPNPVVATLFVSPKRAASLPETPLSSLLLSSGDTTRVPCGTCYVVDYTDGRNVTFPGGLDVIGRLRFPPGADVTIRATSVVVQGILRVDPPDAGARSGFVLYENEGEHEVHRVVPHGENAKFCGGEGCDVGRMPFVVVGGEWSVVGIRRFRTRGLIRETPYLFPGRLDVNGLRDPTCDSHVELLALDDTRKVLTVGQKVAGCWWDGPVSIDTEIYLTSPDSDMDYDFTAALSGADLGVGTLIVSEALPERFGYATKEISPEYAVRVASLRRSFFLTAEEAEGKVDGETDRMLIGGHLMVFLTPGVAQKLEGVEITNFGQQGNLGRYASTLILPIFIKNP